MELEFTVTSSTSLNSLKFYESLEVALRRPDEYDDVFRLTDDQAHKLFEILNQHFIF